MARLQSEAEEAARLHAIGLEMSYDLNEDDAGVQPDVDEMTGDSAVEDVAAGSG